MTDKIFAVIRTRGPRWNDSQPMEGQEDWRPHADFMNALEAEGFMLLAGPLVGTRDVLLIVRAEDEQEVEKRLAADCWTVKDLLRTRQISPWWLRLGSLGAP
ncbi:MAG TPA: YciI family protein [Reyranella sp.]